MPHDITIVDIPDIRVILITSYRKLEILDFLFTDSALNLR
jgi:hypothetical protein